MYKFTMAIFMVVAIAVLSLSFGIFGCIAGIILSIAISTGISSRENAASEAKRHEEMMELLKDKKDPVTPRHVIDISKL